MEERQSSRNGNNRLTTRDKIIKQILSALKFMEQWGRNCAFPSPFPLSTGFDVYTPTETTSGERIRETYVTCSHKKGLKSPGPTWAADTLVHELPSLRPPLDYATSTDHNNSVWPALTKG